MNATEIKRIRKKVGLSQRDLEIELGMKGCDGRTVRYWESGDKDISGPCAKLMRLMDKHGINL